MLTGRGVPAQNGIRDYFDALPDGAPTIARALNARAYETLFFGKWHLAARDRNAPLTGEAHARAIVPPESRGGFGFWEGFESGFLLNDPWLHGTRLPEPVQFKGYQSSVVCRRALERLTDSPGPWFAMVSLEAPHPPYGAPADGVRPPDAGKIELRANVAEGAEARARSDLSGYYAHIEATDRAIGKLVAGLRGRRSSCLPRSTATCTARTGFSGRDGRTRRVSACPSWCGRDKGPGGMPGADFPDRSGRNDACMGRPRTGCRAGRGPSWRRSTIRESRCRPLWRFRTSATEDGRGFARRSCKLILGADGEQVAVFRFRERPARIDQPCARSRAPGGDRCR